MTAEFEITAGKRRPHSVVINGVDLSDELVGVSVSMSVDNWTSLRLTRRPVEGVIRGVAGQVVHRCVDCHSAVVEDVHDDSG